VVDDFGVQYVGKEKKWNISSKHCKKHMKCLSIGRDHYIVVLHSNGITSNALLLFQCRVTSKRLYIDFNTHPLPNQPQHSPYPAAIPTYGAKVQYAEDPDTSLASRNVPLLGSSNRSLAHSNTTPVQLTPPCL
jgi:hypothetical protein